MKKQNVSAGHRGLNRGKGVEGPVAQAAIYVIMAFVLFLAVLPIYITVIGTVKTNFEQQMSIWAFPKTPVWSNWKVGFQGILPNMLNSVIVALISTVIGVLFGAMTAYVFTRTKFPGKEVIFSFIIALMVVPGVLTMTPQYLLIVDMGIKDTWLALILPYIAGCQVGTIFLFRTFLGQQPEELYEAAQMDGAKGWQMFFSITLPLAVPVIAIQAIGVFASLYNDFMWPILVITDNDKQVLMPVLRQVASNVSGLNGQQGIVYVMYLLSSIPLIFTTLLGLKRIVSGEFASGLKL